MKWLLLLTILTFVGLALVVWSPSSKEYWQNVGPSWDKMLNPDTHND